ncbi:MAG: amidoligase family protein [Prevotellaceae bacterium]|jgi:hypothetical protein|nr:amidoligase family protein [Prevotellaceae bacterium]
MNINKEIEGVLKSDASNKKKRDNLSKLGLRPNDIKVLLSIYAKTGDSKTAIMLYTFGVEIECFNVDKERFISLATSKKIKIEAQRYNHDTQQVYKVVSDASIVGEKAIECVSPVLKGKKGLNSLKKVCDCLREAGAKVNKSTGLHIHVGLDNIDFETYKNIFINYAMLEGAIDSFMSESRRGNNNRYCKSLENYLFYSQNVTPQNHDDIMEAFHGDRYCKVNPCSYARHKTIEFRQHQGTTDFEKINNWLNFLMKLIDYSKSNILAERIYTVNEIPFLTATEKEYFNNRATALS